MNDKNSQATSRADGSLKAYEKLTLTKGPLLSLVAAQVAPSAAPA